MDPVTKINNKVKINTALISVFYKDGLEDLVKGLVEINPSIKIISTGGTYNKIEKVIPSNNLINIADYNNAPEIDGGLVKTLSRKISMSLLTDTYNKNHQERNKIENVIPIDMVINNLYPFQDVEKDSIETARIYIDIGGPTMLREAAKNFLRVLVVTDQNDYKKVINDLKERNGYSDLGMRLEYSKKVWTVMANYNKAIAEFINTQGPESLDIYDMNS